MTRRTLRDLCDDLRARHRGDRPLLLPNAWDVASARAVVDAGFPVVATTSGGVAASLGYEDHEGAPAAEMLAVATRISCSVDVPVTVDAEAGYGMGVAGLVDALERAGAAGCNLEDTDHAHGTRRDPARHAAWLAAVRAAAAERGYGLVINARIDVFLADILAGSRTPQGELLADAVPRARAYLAAGADCVFPIALWEREPLAEFVAQVGAPVNVLATPHAPSIDELAAMGVARISWGSLMHHDVMRHFSESLTAIA